VKARSLQDLAALRDTLRQRQAEAARQRAADDAEQRRQAQARQAFAQAVGAVQRLPEAGRVHGHAPRPEPHPRQREADERAALREALSDEVDVESLLLTDDGLSFRRPGLNPDVVTRLRRGQWSIQAQLDLHGLRRDEAREQLGAFVRQSLRSGCRCVRVVHGKGLGSPGGEPVLKAKVQRWLAQCAEVIAFAQATAAQGGAGALVVLLERRTAAR
jgi:DNA-nicking Smr family endonuclease